MCVCEREREREREQEEREREGEKEKEGERERKKERERERACVCGREKTSHAPSCWHCIVAAPPMPVATATVTIVGLPGAVVGMTGPKLAETKDLPRTVTAFARM